MRLALMTGGSRGLGRALADALAAEGFAIIEFSRGAPHPYSVPTDLSKPLEAYRTICDALARIEPQQVDELLAFANAATIEPIGPTSGKTPGAIVANLNVNITSAVLFFSAIIARFQAARGRKVLVNVSAGAAQNGVFGWSLYCAAKVGMDNFIHSLSIEQRDLPVPFIPVSIDPGVVDTDIHAIAASASATDFPAAAKFRSRRAEGQLTPPAQAAGAIVKLLLSSHLVPGASYDARDVEA